MYSVRRQKHALMWQRRIRRDETSGSLALTTLHGWRTKPLETHNAITSTTLKAAEELCIEVGERHSCTTGADLQPSGGRSHPQG